MYPAIGNACNPKQHSRHASASSMRNLGGFFHGFPYFRVAPLIVAIDAKFGRPILENRGLCVQQQFQAVFMKSSGRNGEDAHDEEQEVSVPEDFPHDPVPAAIAGAQMKFAAREVDGRYVVGLTEDERRGRCAHWRRRSRPSCNACTWPRLQTRRHALTHQGALNAPD